TGKMLGFGHYRVALLGTFDWTAQRDSAVGGDDLNVVSGGRQRLIFDNGPADVLRESAIGFSLGLIAGGEGSAAAIADITAGFFRGALGRRCRSLIARGLHQTRRPCARDD